MQRSAWVLLFSLTLTGCGGSNPYLEQSLEPGLVLALKLGRFERLFKIGITTAAAGQGQTEKENPSRSLHRALSSVE